jgi:hypothetical protein
MRVSVTSAALVAQFIHAIQHGDIARKVVATNRLCPALDELAPRAGGWSKCTTSEVLAGFRALLRDNGPAIRASIEAELFTPIAETLGAIEAALSE